MSSEERAKIGIPDGFLRMSIGIENAEDLIADIEQALQH
jgi:cystathionine beta-lyase/cystathionine gamma-synthase